MKGSIIKREGKRGTSYLLKYDAGIDPQTGKRRQRYKTIHGSKRDAERELRKLLGQVDTGTHVDPSKMTVGMWCESWLADVAAHKVTSKTLQRYGELLRLHVVAHIGAVPVQRLTAPQIQAMYSKLRAEGGRARAGLALRTLHHLHRTLHQALASAVRQRVIVHNPAGDVDAPRAPAADISVLDETQIETLLVGLLGDPIRPLVVLALGTGARLGELLALRWSAVALDHRRMRVDASLEETTTPYRLSFKSPKTTAGRREILLPESVVAVLRTHRGTQASDALACGSGLPPDALVFPVSVLEPLRPQSPREMSRQFKRAAGRAGVVLPPRNAMHVLRHTHATQLLAQGIDARTVSERLGHARVSITLDTYAHVLPKMEQGAADAAGRMLGALD